MPANCERCLSSVKQGHLQLAEEIFSKKTGLFPSILPREDFDCPFESDGIPNSRGNVENLRQRREREKPVIILIRLSLNFFYAISSSRRRNERETRICRICDAIRRGEARREAAAACSFLFYLSAAYPSIRFRFCSFPWFDFSQGNSPKNEDTAFQRKLRSLEKRKIISLLFRSLVPILYFFC